MTATKRGRGRPRVWVNPRPRINLRLPQEFAEAAKAAAEERNMSFNKLVCLALAEKLGLPYDEVPVPVDKLPANQATRPATVTTLPAADTTDTQQVLPIGA